MILVPIKEEYYPFPDQVYFCQFQIGFLNVTFGVIDSTNLKRVIENETKREAPKKIKKYICICTINTSRGWIYNQTDDLNEAKLVHFENINKLKEGEAVELRDVSSQQNKPIRISWRAIEFDWDIDRNLRHE